MISIIIPVYNCERYIAEAIKSAINQTWEDKEIIVIDDGSTDGTADIVKEYKVTYIYKSNGGTGSALNMGIKLARGDWIKWLSADDVLYPDALELMMRHVVTTSNHDNMIFYTDYDIIDKDGKILKKFQETRRVNQKKDIMRAFYGNGSSSLIHKHVFDKIGLFQEISHSEDYEFWLRATFNGVKLELIQENTLQYRTHPGQLTHKVGGGMDRILKEPYIGK